LRGKAKQEERAKAVWALRQRKHDHKQPLLKRLRSRHLPIGITFVDALCCSVTLDDSLLQMRFCFTMLSFVQYCGDASSIATFQKAITGCSKEIATKARNWTHRRTCSKHRDRSNFVAQPTMINDFYSDEKCPASCLPLFLVFYDGIGPSKSAHELFNQCTAVYIDVNFC
jgi:hypothetical protein